jgi:TnpA family transposase
VGQSGSHFNAKYGTDPGVTFYTHISDQYAPFHTRVIHVPVRDATYVLDGLLNHESDLRIEEHYTDTAGVIDHVFGLMHLLGFRFAPRIRDLKDKNLYVYGDAKAYPTLSSLVGGPIQVILASGSNAGSENRCRPPTGRRTQIQLHRKRKAAGLDTDRKPCVVVFMV